MDIDLKLISAGAYCIGSNTTCYLADARQVPPEAYVNCPHEYGGVRALFDGNCDEFCESHKSGLWYQSTIRNSTTCDNE